jgi:phosphoribosylformimino-5-aminoimidazole carboxamide ribotide isomerase
MLVIPAIDLLGGRCVRLLRGEFGSSKEYASDPADMARRFQDAGARWLHVVDLDAARGRGEDNRKAIASIRSAVDARIEAGGGIRREEDVRALLSMGVDRLVLGTVLARSPETACAWAGRFGPVFLGGLDALDGMVKVSGWTDDASLKDTDFARSFRRLGMRGVIHTSIGRDGTLQGPDLAATAAVAEAAGLPTVVSGGVGSFADVEAVFRGGSALVAGVIVGKALYEGRVDLAALVRAFQTEAEAASGAATDAAW